MHLRLVNAADAAQPRRILMTDTQPKTSDRQTQNGGLYIEWIVSRPIRPFTRKRDGSIGSIIELRDPAMLGNSVTIFADGEPGALEKVPVHTLVKLRLDEVSGGSNGRRGELTGSAERSVIDAAFKGIS